MYTFLDPTEEPVSEPLLAAPAARHTGFTLVEVVMAISILILLTVSTVIAMVPVSRQNRLNREIEAAVAEVRNVLEKVQATPFNDVTTLYPPGNVISIDALQNGRILITYIDPDADPLVLQVDLSWDSEENMGTINRTFFTVRTE